MNEINQFSCSAISLLGQATDSEIDWFAIFMGLFGGLALFLYGMDKMSESLKLVAGDGMKKVLAKLTTNRFTGAIAGAMVTAVIQSSSVTTVLVVGFISAQLLTLPQSIGVIMGANVGTTITAQIIAFNVTQYALLMIGSGFAMRLLFTKEKICQYGDMILGLGLIFFGMHLMSDGANPLRSYQPFIELMKQMDEPFYGILLGAAFTGIIQSSSATTGIVIVLASQGFISLEAGIAIIFGANIGTCVTAVLAAIGKSREAVRASLVHVIFNVGGVVLWYWFIPQLAHVVELLSPKASHLVGMPKLAAETPRQIANAHTIFNVSNTLIFIWFTAPIAWIVTRLVPDRSVQAIESAKPKFLDELLFVTPSLAMDLVRLELGRLGAGALHMVRRSLPTILDGTEDELARLQHMDNDVDQLHAAIITYLGRLSKENLSEDQSEQLQVCLSTANYLESMADLIETNLAAIGRQRLKRNITIGPKTREMLIDYHEQIARFAELAVKSLVQNDRIQAQQVLDAKPKINALAHEMENHLTSRLAAEEPNRLYTFRLESETIDYLKRVFYFAKRIAKLVIESETKPPQSESE